MDTIKLVVLVALCMLIGWVARGLVSGELRPVMAYGLQEDKQVWNRIRVNDEGRVYCVK